MTGTQLVIPRKYGGCDHGSETLVLAHRGDTYRLFVAPNGLPAYADAVALVWRRAGKAWTGRLSGYQPFPASLVLLRRVKGVVKQEEITLSEGGRLSARLLAEHATAIDEMFGAAVSKELHPKHTVAL